MLYSVRFEIFGALMKKLTLLCSVLALSSCSSMPSVSERAAKDMASGRQPAADSAAAATNAKTPLSPAQQCSEILSVFKTGKDFSSTCGSFQSNYSVSALLLVLSGDSLGMASTMPDLASLGKIKNSYALLALGAILEERRQSANPSQGWAPGLNGRDFEQIGRISTFEELKCLRNNASVAPNSCSGGDELTNFYFCRVDICIAH